EEDGVTRSLEQIADQLPRFVGLRRPAVGDRDHATLHRGGGVLLVFLRHGHGSDGGEDRGASKGSRAISTLNKVNLRRIRNACGWPSHRETEEGGDTNPRGGIVERRDERGQGVKRPCADDACRALRPDPREGRDGRQRRAVHVEWVLDRGEGTLSVAHDAHVDEPVHPGPVRQPDEDRIRADLSTVRHMAVLQPRNTSRRTVPSGTTRRSISWSIVLRTASLNRRNSRYSPVGSNSRRTGRTCRMLIRRTHRSSSRSCFKNARFRSNVLLVSPSRPATKFSPGKRMGMPVPPRSLPTAFTMRTASRQSSASMLRLFASVTRGSADSSPNDNELPGQASRARSRIGSMQKEHPLLTYRTQPFDVSSSTVSGSGKSGWSRTTSAPRRAQRSHSSIVLSRCVHSDVVR